MPLTPAEEQELALLRAEQPQSEAASPLTPAEQEELNLLREDARPKNDLNSVVAKGSAVLSDVIAAPFSKEFAKNVFVGATRPLAQVANAILSNPVGPAGMSLQDLTPDQLPAPLQIPVPQGTDTAKGLVGQMVGGVLDPVGKVITMGVAPLVKTVLPGLLKAKEAVQVAEKAKDAQAFSEASKGLYRALKTEATIAEGVSGATQGLLEGQAISAENRLDPEKAAKVTFGAAALNAGSSALLGRLGASVGNRVLKNAQLPALKATPASDAINVQLEDLQEKALRFSNILTKKEERLAAKIVSTREAASNDLIKQRIMSDQMAATTIEPISREITSLTQQIDQGLGTPEVTQRLSQLSDQRDDLLREAAFTLNETNAARQAGFQKRYQALSDQYDGIYNRLPDKPTSKQVEAMHEALSTNLKEQAALRRISKGFEIELPKSRSMQAARDVAYKQVLEVQNAERGGFLNPESSQKLQQLVHDETLSLFGVLPPKDGAINPLYKNFSEHFKNDLRDRRLGTRTGEVTLDALMARQGKANWINDNINQAEASIKGLEDLGIPSSEQSRLFQYVESDLNGNIIFNPAASAEKGNSRAAYTGPDLAPEVIGHLQNLRRQYDVMLEGSGISGYRTGYVARRATQTPLLPGPKGSSAEGIFNPAAGKKRTNDFLDPEIHETDLRVLTQRYANEVGKAKFFDQPLSNAIAEVNKMRLSGHLNDAEDFRKSIVKLFNLKDTKELGDIFANKVVNVNRDVLEKIALQTDNPQHFLDKVHTNLSTLMYTNLVSTNPKSLWQQAWQPVISGAFEVGAGKGLKARFLVGKNQKTKLNPQQTYGEIADRLKRLGTLEIEQIDNLSGSLADNKFIKTLNKPFNSLENANRKGILIQAYRSFEDALSKGKVAKEIASLSGSEQNIVNRTLAEKGELAAAEIYAVIRNNRVNTIYDIANKPELLSSGLGKHIPFTTFARNNLELFAQDALNGRTREGATRAALKVAVTMLPYMMGDSMVGNLVSGLSITESAKQTLDPRTSPIFKPARDIAKGNFGEAAVSGAMLFVPGAQLGKKIIKAVKDE